MFRVPARNESYNMNHLDGPENEVAKWLEFSFTLFYTIELILKLTVHQWHFFVCADWRWNCFDMFLAAFGIWDQIEDFCNLDAAGENVSFLRITRLLKMIRVLRMIRLMRMFLA